jgi:hypothetical protein
VLLVWTRKQLVEKKAEFWRWRTAVPLMVARESMGSLILFGGVSSVADTARSLDAYGTRLALVRW